MLKDEQDCSYNGGGVLRPLKTWSEFSTGQYIQKAIFCETFLYTKSKKINPVYVRIFFKAQILRALLSNKNGILNF